MVAPSSHIAFACASACAVHARVLSVVAWTVWCAGACPRAVREHHVQRDELRVVRERAEGEGAPVAARGDLSADGGEGEPGESGQGPPSPADTDTDTKTAWTPMQAEWVRKAQSENEGQPSMGGKVAPRGGVGICMRTMRGDLRGRSCARRRRRGRCGDPHRSRSCGFADTQMRMVSQGR